MKKKKKNIFAALRAAFRIQILTFQLSDCLPFRILQLCIEKLANSCLCSQLLLQSHTFQQIFEFLRIREVQVQLEGRHCSVDTFPRTFFLRNGDCPKALIVRTTGTRCIGCLRFTFLI